ncbi:hypothetical protein GC167_09330 [bacterium]|nr:hypothetical protein [bacterium]
MTEQGPLFDLKQLDELSAGNPDFISVMIDTFLTHTPEQVDQLVSAYEEGNLKRMGEIANKLKPSIDLFGISGLTATVRSIEQKGKAEHRDDKLSSEVFELKRGMTAVFQELQKMRPQ